LRVAQLLDRLDAYSGEREHLFWTNVTTRSLSASRGRSFNPGVHLHAQDHDCHHPDGSLLRAGTGSVLLLADNPHGGEHQKDLLVGQILWVD